MIMIPGHLTVNSALRPGRAAAAQPIMNAAAAENVLPRLWLAMAAVRDGPATRMSPAAATESAAAEKRAGRRGRY